MHELEIKCFKPELYKNSKIIKDISSDESKEKLITRNMKNNAPP
jgi:hypothetical protein